jgi:polyhydroxyalkanoate synthesis regulator phasin
VTPSTQDDQSRISESLRRAIESTFAATAGSAGDTRERASELLDEVARRGRGAREQVVRRSQEARDEVVRRGSEASADVVGRVDEELRSISERLAKLEAALRRQQR